MKNLKKFWDFINESVDDIQDKADAINRYGKLAKRKDIDDLISLFIEDRDYNMGEYLKDYIIILKKYNLYDDVMNGVKK
jgi:hypothetical protein